MKYRHLHISLCFCWVKKARKFLLKFKKIKLDTASRSRQGVFKSNFLIPCFFYVSKGNPMTVTPLTARFSDQWDLAAAEGLVLLLVNS